MYKCVCMCVIIIIFLGGVGEGRGGRYVYLCGVCIKG